MPSCPFDSRHSVIGPTLSYRTRAYAGDDQIVWPVGKEVGCVRNNGPTLVEPIKLKLPA
jgi:hypothetical protein